MLTTVNFADVTEVPYDKKLLLMVIGGKTGPLEEIQNIYELSTMPLVTPCCNSYSTNGYTKASFNLSLSLAKL